MSGGGAALDPPPRLRFPRTVWLLGLVSLCNDAASEMITPLLPAFLTAVLGAAPAAVGLIEGLAEATSSVLKLVSGRLADRGASVRGLVVGGYGASNLARPLIALAASWPAVLALRFADRAGKGLRTSPRDALLAASVDERRRGAVFGFHRGMDHAGAVIGPLLAFTLLRAGHAVREVFAVSLVPGAGVIVLLVLGLREPPSAVVAPPPLRWRALDRDVRRLVAAAGLLALAHVPDAFLVLWAFEGGTEMVWLPVLWAGAHAARSLVSFPAGALSDRFGRVPVVLVGWLARAGALALIGAHGWSGAALWALFFAHAAATACTEGAERALIGDRAPAKQRGTAFGVYHLVSGLAALPAALVFGALWQVVGRGGAFTVAAAATLVGATAFLLAGRRRA